MEIQPATEHDAIAVAALWTQAYADDPRGGRKTPYGAADFHVTAAAGDVMVVRDGDELAGVIAVLESGVHAGQVAREGEAELSRLVVAALYRRRGIARSLVQHGIRLADERHASALALWSRPAQTDAHHLYSSVSFSRAPDRDDEDENGPRLVFVRSLLGP